MSKDIQIREAMEHEEANINLMSTLPDRVLAERLDTVHIQMDLAAAKKNTAALELLEIWRSQIIAARIFKAENAIEDEVSEIRQAIAGIETYVAKTEERKEILREYMNPPKPLCPKAPHTTEEGDSQLSLF